MVRSLGSAELPAEYSADSSAERPAPSASHVDNTITPLASGSAEHGVTQTTERAPQSTIASLASGSADYGVTESMELAPKQFVFDDGSDCDVELSEDFRRSMTEEDLLRECWHVLDSLLAAQPEQSASLLSTVGAQWRRERLACIIAVLHGLLVLYCV